MKYDLTQDENKSRIYRKKIEFPVYYITFYHFDLVIFMVTLYMYLLIWILEESDLTEDQWKYGKYVSLYCPKIYLFYAFW